MNNLDPLDIIRILCKGSDNEEEFRAVAKQFYPPITNTDMDFYWNSYHAITSSSELLKAMGVHGSDLEAALKEVGEYISEQHQPEDETEFPDNITPIKKH